MLILTRCIAKKELAPLQRHFSVEDLQVGARKVLSGLGQGVAFAKLRGGFKFFKVRIGKGMSGRMIVFVVTENKKVVPLLIRLKKDKKLGINMSAKNPHVVEQLSKNLENVLNDIENGDFEEFSL